MEHKKNFSRVLQIIVSIISIISVLFLVWNKYAEINNKLIMLSEKVNLLSDHLSKNILDRLSYTDTRRLVTMLFRETGNFVDSGYSKSIVFSPVTSADNNFLIFHAKPGQEVDLTISAHASNSTTSLLILVDNYPWKKVPSLPFTTVRTTITKFLQYDLPPGGNIHIVKFIPENLSDDDLVVIEVIVIVKNVSIS